MANPEYHARSSAKKFGGNAEYYLPLHQFFDSTKAHDARSKHRLILHNSFGIFVAEQLFGSREEVRLLRQALQQAVTELREHDLFEADRITDMIPVVTPVTVERGPDHKTVPIRAVAEQHVLEDLGYIPSLASIIDRFPDDAELAKKARPLSKEFEA